MARAVHRLLAERAIAERVEDSGRRQLALFAPLVELVELVGRDRQVHAVAKFAMCPLVSNRRLVEDLRRDHFFVAVVDVQLAHVLDEPVVDARAARQEERHRRRASWNMKSSSSLPSFRWSRALRLLEQLQVLSSCVLRRKGRAVDALQHRVRSSPRQYAPATLVSLTAPR